MQSYANLKGFLQNAPTLFQLFKSIALTQYQLYEVDQGAHIIVETAA